MPEIRVVEPHALPVDTVPGRLGAFDTLLGKYGVHLEWTGGVGKVRGVPGVGGQITVRPADVEVYVTLSRMITMLGLDPVRLESTIRKRLVEALSSGG